MPTKKPILQVVIEQETYEKFRDLCSLENKKMSAKANELIIDFITNEVADKNTQIKYYAEKLYKLTKGEEKYE